MSSDVFADISVVIPVKDRLNDLRMAVSSVRRQIIPPRELIIVDDASVVPVVYESFAIPLPTRLKIIRNKINLGAAEACNRGLAEASCSIVSFLDSDDYFGERYIAEISSAWKLATADTVCVAAGFWWCTNELAPYRTQVIRGTVDLRELLMRGNIVGGNSVLSVRRREALAVGGFPPLRGASDWGLLIRLARRGRIETVPRPLVYYRSPSATALDNDTNKFRRQIVSVFGIMREQPSVDRPLMRRFAHQFLCLSSAQLGRRSLSIRLLFAYLARYGLDQSVLMSAFALAAGPIAFGRAIRNWAVIRAWAGRIKFGRSPSKDAPPLARSKVTIEDLNIAADIETNQEALDAISVVIPVRDRLPSLRRAVTSLAGRMRPDDELVIVDDGSECPINEVDLNLEGRVFNLIILRHSISVGAGAARNRGAWAARSGIVAFLDSDDAFAEDYLPKVRAAWRTNPESICIATGFFWCTDELRPYRKHLVVGSVTRRRLLQEGNIVGGASVMSVDRRRFMEVGGFPLTRGSQDWGLLLRLAKAGTIFALRDPLVYYRSPVFADDTLSSKYRWQILSIAEIVRTLLDKDERLLVAGLRRRLVLQHLLRADRRQLARRILAGVVAHELKAPNHSLALLASIALPRKLSFQLHVSVDKIRAYVFRSVNSAASKRLAVRLDHDHFQL